MPMSRRRISALLVLAAIGLPATAHADPTRDAWVQDALASQYELGSSLPLVNAPTIGTHNSFNSPAEMGITVSAGLNPNHAIPLVDQLELGIRSLELDIHRFPSPAAGGPAPIVCHALGTGIGCTAEKHIATVIAEIEGWLRRPENSRQVLFLYLEDHMDQLPTYDEAAAAIDASIGDLIYKPPPSSGECAELPANTLTRDDIRAAGKQVYIVSNCGQGAAYNSLIHTWNNHLETRPRAFEDFPACGPDFTRADYDTKLVRYFEDRTRLTNTVEEPDDGLTPETVAAMTRCGVDLIGLDMLLPSDPRLEAFVWSWAPHEPGPEDSCAFIATGEKRPFGRWTGRDCDARRRVACLIDGRWSVAKKARALGGRPAARLCKKRGGRIGIPRSGFENQQLRLAMEKRGVKSAWLDY